MMSNTTGMATKYLLDMLQIGGKTEPSVGEGEPKVSTGQKVTDGEQSGQSNSITSSNASVMQSMAESDMSLSVGEIPGYLDGSTPRISLHSVNQTIQLGSNEYGSSVYGNQVEIVTRQNSGVSSTSSNKIKFNQMVKYDWELKYYKGNLIAKGGQFIAYTLKGRTGYVIRLLNPQTASRALIKEFIGLVTDLAFSHRESNTLACVDEGGNVYVWNVTEEDGKIEYFVKLHVKRSKQPMSEFHKIFWGLSLPDDEDEDDDDEDRSLAVSHDNQVEMIDVAMVIARCNTNVIDVEMLHQGEGYVSIVDGHTKTITDGCLSPDNSILATGSEDGYVKFWQVSEMMPNSKHPCLHEFQPHDGAPLASLMFCDNHLSSEKDVPMWRFMITGAEYNREIKIWCTVKWTCLQTLRFTSPSADIESVLGGSYFKMHLDITARYLVLSDIGRKVLYVLLLHQNREEGVAHVTSVTDFQLTQSLLSFVITKAKLFQLKSSDSPSQENGHSELDEDGYAESPDELDESELDRLQRKKNLMVQLKLLSIHTKSLQELLVHLQPEPSVAPPTPSMISSLNTSIGQGARDALSDWSGMDTGTEASTDIEESDNQATEMPSPSVQPKLITPEAFSQSFKDPSRPESSSSNVSSATLVSALNSSQDSMKDSITSSLSSKITESILKSSVETPRRFHDNTAGILTPTSLPLPGTPPFSSSAPDPTTVPIPTFSTSRISPMESTAVLKSPTVSANDIHNDKGTDDRDLTTPTPGSSEGSEIMSPVGTRKEPLSIASIQESPACQESKSPHSIQDEDLDNTWMTATTSEQTPAQISRIKKLHSDSRLTSSPISNVDITPSQELTPVKEDLSSSIGEILQLMKAQQQQISSLRQELRTYQSAQNNSELLRKEVGKLEDRINNVLAEHSSIESQRLDKALKERQVADKKKQEHLTSTLSQAVTNSISGKLEKTLKNEIKVNVVPVIHKIITPIQEQLNTTMAQKLTAADAVLKDSINKLLKNKSIIESIGTSAAVALQGPIQATYREAFQNTIVPAFERACQAMFHQINENFQKGTQQYLQKVTATIQEQIHQQESQDANLEKILKAQIQRNSTSIVRDVESVLNKQLATALHSLREELTTRFESQVKLSLQETLKTEVKTAMQELNVTQFNRPVSETIPQQATVDPKVRIGELIQSGNYGQAFQDALTAADLNLVVFVCENVDSNELFAQSPPPLGQPILLSLIQQLSVDLLSNTELKHRFLTDAVMALDPLDEVTSEHMPAVLKGLCQQLTYAIQESQGKLQKSLKMLHMAAKSLIR